MTDPDRGIEAASVIFSTDVIGTVRRCAGLSVSRIV
jgi:hypothetical protein